MRRIIFFIALALACAAPTLSSAQEPWRTTATVYLWASSIEQDLTGGTTAEVDFDTILENLDFAFMGEVTQQRGRFIMGVEGFYVDVGKAGSTSFPVTNAEPDDPDSIDAVGDFTTISTFVHGWAGYLLTDDPNVQLYGTAGLRYTRFDTELEVDANGASFRFETDEELTDLTLGVRGRARLSDAWSVPFVLDVGGGTSDFTWQALAGISYDFGQNSLTLGYRQMEWNIGDAAEVLERVNYGGPIFAYTRRF